MMFKNVLIVIAILAAGVDASAKGVESTKKSDVSTKKSDAVSKVPKAPIDVDPKLAVMQKHRECLAKDYKDLMTNDHYGTLYGLYKQYTEDDAPKAALGLDFLGGAKHAAWTRFRGKSKEECFKLYEKRVKEIKALRK